MRTRLIPLLLLMLVLAGCSGKLAQGRGDRLRRRAADRLSGQRRADGAGRRQAGRGQAEPGRRSAGLSKSRSCRWTTSSDFDVAVAMADEVAAAVAGGEQVLGVIGHYNSGQTLAAMETYKDLPIIVITPTASETSISQRGYRNFFRVNANDAVQAQRRRRLPGQHTGRETCRRGPQRHRIRHRAGA